MLNFNLASPSSGSNKEGSSHKLYDLIIIGAGPGGMTSALYGVRLGLDVLLIEKMLPAGQLSVIDIIENYPGFDSITGFQLAQKMLSHLNKFDVEIKTNTIVNSLTLNGDVKILKTSDGSVYKAKTVVIATGASPKKLKVEGEKRLTGKGVSYCAVCDAAFFKGKDIAVVGGGSSAFAEALFLTKFANKLYLIHRRQGFRAEKYLQDKLFEFKGLQLVLDSVVKEIKGKEKVEGVLVYNKVTKEEKFIPLSAVFIYIGYNPQTSFLDGLLKLDNAGYIITDEKMQTSVKGIYAIGDVRTSPLRQVITAAADGAIAAASAFEYIENEFKDVVL